MQLYYVGGSNPWCYGNDVVGSHVTLLPAGFVLRLCWLGLVSCRLAKGAELLCGVTPRSSNDFHGNTQCYMIYMYSCIYVIILNNKNCVSLVYFVVPIMSRKLYCFKPTKNAVKQTVPILFIIEFWIVILYSILIVN